jgi:hypothetical protein
MPIPSGYVSGQVIQAVVGVGKVLQVVTTVYSTQVSTTSTSYVTTGQTATITPSATSSKILVICNLGAQGATGQNMNLTIFRGTVAGTNLAASAEGMGLFATGANVPVAPLTISYLDSPSTTSAQAYTVGMKTTGGTVYANIAGVTGSLTLMEISA